MAYTILEKAYSNNFETSLSAAETISPGHFVELASATTVQKHSTAGGVTAKMVAIESDLQGNDVDNDYTSGNIVLCYHGVEGDLINAVFATGSDIEVGEFLESAGDGTVRQFTTGEKIAIAQEDTIASGLTSLGDADAATTSALPAVTYDNGTLGVGATLTADATGALAAIDGVTLSLNEKLLVQDQVAGLQNGLYKYTTAGVTEVSATPSGVITYGTPNNTDTVVFTDLPTDGTKTFTKVASGPGADEFTTIAELTALIDALTDLGATDDGTDITLTVSTAGAGMNSATVTGTGTYSALSLSFSGGVTGVAFVFTRDTNNDETDEFVDRYVKVTAGTANGNKRFECSNATAPTVGTTAITWAAFASAAGARFAVELI